MTAPQHFTNQAPPIPGAGLSVAGVEAPVRRHRCGRCANPYTYGREDCRNNTQSDEPEPVLNPFQKPEYGSDAFWDAVDDAWDRMKEVW